ncbi:MAG: hypothetical protein V3U16_08300 [Candidatus Neomarinimicrobiota bacterium]
MYGTDAPFTVKILQNLPYALIFALAAGVDLGTNSEDVSFLK